MWGLSYLMAPVFRRSFSAGLQDRVFIPILYHHGGATRAVDRPVERVQLSGRLFSFTKDRPPGRPARERPPVVAPRAARARDTPSTFDFSHVNS